MILKRGQNQVAEMKKDNYPTLTCEYNIALKPHYRKKNSPEFATL